MNQANLDLYVQVREILKSGPIPQWTVIARRDIKKSKVDALTGYFPGMQHSPAGKTALAAAGFDFFAAAGEIDSIIVQK